METSDPNNEDQNTGKEPLALVQWIGGSDSGNFSFVPTHWIRNFSTEEFLRDCNDDNTCDANSLAKCRSTRRKSKFGWKVDNAVVVKVLSSGKDMGTVVNAVGGYERIQNVARKFAEPQEEPQSLNRSSRNWKKSVDAAENTCCSSSSSSLSQQLITMEQTNQNNEKKIEALSKSVSLMSQKMDVLTNLVQTLVKNQPQPATPNVTQTFAKTVANPLAKPTEKPAAKPTEKSAAKTIAKPTAKSKKSAKPKVKSENVRKNFKVGSQYEIGQEGSGVFVDRNQWCSISSRRTPTSLAVALVKALIPRNILLISNLRGGASRIRKNDSPNFAALDSTILDAIYDHVAIKFPKWNYKVGDLGKAINAMLNDLRGRNRRSGIKREIKDEIKEEPIDDLCNEDDFA